MVLFALVLIVIAALAGFFYFITRTVARAPAALIEKAIGKEEEQIDLTAVVIEMQRLSRLETAAMRVSHVSTIRQSYGVIPNALAGDELTLFAVGDVIAGVDLGEFQKGDAWIEEENVLVLRLPQPRILVSRLDNQKTRVIDRETGLLRRTDVHLESRARENAERGIRREAVRTGLLQQAADNAEVTLSRFLGAMGIERLRFVSPEVPQIIH
ncbi:MAG TPA: DUF4230 domain-containing protein [Thermoanaerobaculia bacterium]|nr:DUF4230 domain-containing protein [Thermoanaerobaculia bacterium]